jgi:hypothetical protein
MTPPGTPKDNQKVEKTLKNVTWKTTLKKTLEKSEKEPDLAREREARFSRITRKSVVEIF